MKFYYILLVIVMFFTLPVKAEPFFSFSRPQDPAGIGYKRQNSSIIGAPTAVFGTHTNRVGLSLTLNVPLSDIDKSLNFITFYGQTAFTMDKSPLGIPDDNFQLFAMGGFVFGDGKPGYRKAPFPVAGRHNFFYHFEYFYDTNDTSQLNGAMGYIFSGQKHAVRVIFENDILTFQGFDRYRTGALELTVHFSKWSQVWGVGAGFLAWTGETPRPNNLTKDDVYDLSNRHGGNYSHGMLYGILIYRMLKLSIGWDSEAIRDKVQNTIHHAIDDGKVPPIDRKSRFVFMISINPTFSLY
ncbi:hypothetical protein KKF34_00050 [Myxococcota bacterium]|nr:hypothetical protein [Myxococcota bacterium]MBU1382974.1 hypothetical protein [Myxococcota bacterium]MBU1495251.1 hypothetical protein [Myxococcota bacterium]